MFSKTKNNTGIATESVKLEESLCNDIERILSDWSVKISKVRRQENDFYSVIIPYMNKDQTYNLHIDGLHSLLKHGIQVKMITATFEGLSLFVFRREK